MSNGEMISELRKMAETKTIDSDAAMRLLLAGVADIFEKINGLIDLKEEVAIYKKRGTVYDVIIAIGAIAALAITLLQVIK